MNCPNCGSNVSQGEMFCRMCGTKIVSQPITENSNNQLNGNQQNYQQYQPNVQQQVINNTQPTYSNYYDDEELINAYIGKNVDKIKAGGFSVNTFFCGVIYVLYRKMWLLGITWFLASIICSIFLSSICEVLLLIASIVISFNFKKWYIKHVEEKVAEIKANNPNASHEQLLMICKQKGGITVIPIIIYVIICIISVAITIYLTVAISEASANKYYDTNNDSNTSGSESIGNLNFTIPSSFEKGSYSTDSYLSYSMYEYNSNDFCSITISKTNSSYYDSVNDYLEYNIYYSISDTVSSIEQKVVNSSNWSYLSVKRTNNTEYYYVGENNDEIYEIEFSIIDDSGKCSSAYKSIINSLKFN